MLGANVPAIIRGLIAVAWYGIQTYLASAALNIVLLKLLPGLMPYARRAASTASSGCRCSAGARYAMLWVLQAAVFWTGMETIRRFIDFCGPAVYVVMFLLAGYLIYQAGWGAIDLNLGEVRYPGFGVDPGHARRDRPGRVVLLRPDAELRRLLPLRQVVRARSSAATCSACR